MANVSTETKMEQRLRGNLPGGFNTLIYQEDRLRAFSDANTDNLGETVAEYGNNTLTEAGVINMEVQRLLTAMQTPERTIELPATGLAHSAGHILSFAAMYKADQNTPSGTIKDARRAGVDDIVFTPITPEVYAEVTETNQTTYEASGLTGGDTLELIDGDGLPDGGQTADSSLQLDDDEMMLFPGDYPDLSEGQSVVTAIQWNDIDDEDYGPDNGALSTRLSGAHLLAAQGAVVKQTADLDAKVYTDGDAEVVPVGFYLGPGNKVPALV